MLTDGGRLATALLKFVDALFAAAAVTGRRRRMRPRRADCSSVLDCPLESRPEPPPQAASNDDGEPQPQASKIARGAKPIRALTLEAPPVGHSRQDRLLAVSQALGERVRQPGRADRRRGAGDVVLGPPVAGAMPPSRSSSSQAARGSPSRGCPTLPGLISHSPSPRSSSSSAPRVCAGRGRPSDAAERQRHVRMADQADPMALDVQAQLGLQRREHVLPDGVPRAGVDRARPARRG